MKVRFLADANLRRAIVIGLKRREPSVDFMSAAAAGLEGLPDSEVLALAEGEGRILVTHDINTIPGYFRRHIRKGRSSPGVFLVPQALNVGTAIAELHLAWLASSAEDWFDQLAWFPL